MTSTNVFSAALPDLLFAVLFLGVGWGLHAIRTHLKMPQARGAWDAAVQSARQMELRWRTIIDAAPVGLMVVNRAHRIVHANPAACAQFGYSATQLDQLGISALVPESHRAGHETMAERFFSNARQHRLQGTTGIYGRRSDGSVFPADIRLNPLPTQHGETALLAVSILDLTARQLYETRFQAVYDHARDGYAFVDPDLNVTLPNLALRQFLQLHDGDDFSADFARYSPPSQSDGRPSMEAAREHVRTAFETGVAEFEWMHLSRSGEPRPCRISLVRVNIGSAVQAFASIHDLRQTREAEAALLDAKARAEEAAAAKSRFLANMSHEIRTPMNAVLGFAELVLRTELTPRQRDFLEKAYGAGRSLLGIIDAILDVSKLEAGRIEAEHIEFDLDQMLAQVAALTGQAATNKGIEYVFDVPFDLPRYWIGDALRLTQVLVNLTNNAIKFTSTGEVRLVCRLEPAGDDAPARLGFTVSDTGIGIDASQIGALFEPFNQADGTISRRFGGTGLGLSIARQLVAVMGGDLTVTSTLGIGSRFTFSLALDAAPGRDSSAGVALGALRGRRIRLALKRSGMREVLALVLAGMGCKVELAKGDGADAIGATTGGTETAPDYLVIDADSAGSELAAWRPPGSGDAAPAAVPQVVLLGPPGAALADDAGIDALLSRPVNPGLLVRVLADLAPVTTTVPDLAGRRLLFVTPVPAHGETVAKALGEIGVHVDVAADSRIAIRMLDRGGASSFDALLLDAGAPGANVCTTARNFRSDGHCVSLPMFAVTHGADPAQHERMLLAGISAHLPMPVSVPHWCARLAPFLANPPAPRQSHELLPLTHLGGGQVFRRPQEAA